MAKRHLQIEKNHRTPLKDFEKQHRQWKWTLHVYALRLLHKNEIYYISKWLLAASFFVQLTPDFGYSGFLHYIWYEKRVPGKSKFYEVPASKATFKQHLSLRKIS